ncbi:DUF2280 domain-containing protein [Pseudohongiella sp. O18]|uniref:DUF2280 domain-containing protein n=1 Tax=Pseudohongiella sp. O18 TaxID=2904248 RepID=UPI001F39C6FA|nr:DUF2280 domain-containing protein [Pseudohongiella sp. O18]
MAKKVDATIRAFITQSVACFDAPSSVVEAVKNEFAVEVTRQYVESHDPTKRAGAKVGKVYKELFESTREAFLKDTSDIAISHKPVRLRALQRMAAKAESQGNMVLAASLYEQAAKEMGEVFTNRQKHEVKESVSEELADLMRHISNGSAE